jgi:hypothetical protein
VRGYKFITIKAALFILKANNPSGRGKQSMQQLGVKEDT